MDMLGSCPGAQCKSMDDVYDMFLMLEHLFRWKFPYNKYM